MFDLIFEMVCGNEYDVMALVVRDDTLYAVPCDDAMSGYYPVNKKKLKLSDVKIDTFMNCKVDNASVDAILFRKYNNKLDIILVCDSWDGFQPLDD